MLGVGARTVSRRLKSSPGVRLAERNVSGVRMLEQRGKASENLYFSQEDERLLKKLLESNPDIEIAAGASDTVEEKVKLVFLSHGIPPLNKDLISDLVAVLEKEKKEGEEEEES